MKTYTWIERRRIHRKAKAKLGLKSDAQDKYDFMQQCIEGITGDIDTLGEDDAMLICQMLWDEEQDLGEYD